jgi:hypothetical protein
MADFQLLNNEVYDFPIVTRDAAGDIVAAPPGDIDTVASTSTAVTVSLGAMPGGGPSLHIVPIVALSDSTNGGGGIVVTITDSAGLAMAGVPTFSIVANVTPASVGLDLTGVVTTPQTIPTAAGP